MGETTTDSEHGIMLGFEDPMRIDPRRDRFPCCIVWTPLPFITWLVPFIGHVGICREDGVILDFAGPNFVCVDNFAFGAVSRYIQINKAKVTFAKMLPFVLFPLLQVNNFGLGLIRNHLFLPAHVCSMRKETLMRKSQRGMMH